MLTYMYPEELEIIKNKVKTAPKGWVVVAGTYLGGDVMAIREVSPERKILVIDSFEGCGKRSPEDFPTDENYEGAFSAGGVENYLKQFEIQGVKPPNQIIKVWVDNDSIKTVEPRDIAVLFLDLDFYAPTLACIKYLKPMLVKDGVLFIHDYNMKSCPGIKRCCDEENLELTFLAGYLSEWRNKERSKC